MKKATLFLVVSSMVFARIGTVLAEETEAQKLAGQLLTSTRSIRQQAVANLKEKYRKVSDDLMINLQEAVTKHKEDHRYMSPIHCAVLAVRDWHVFEAEDKLISIIDYQLDLASLPVGMKVTGDYFYPAASSLVDIRVDTRKLVNVIGQTKDDQKLRLLTWVVCRRTGSTEDARRVLTAHVSNERIQKALQFLDQAQHAADLLPHPKEIDNGDAAAGKPRSSNGEESEQSK